MEAAGLRLAAALSHQAEEEWTGLCCGKKFTLDSLFHTRLLQLVSYVCTASTVFNSECWQVDVRYCSFCVFS